MKTKLPLTILFCFTLFIGKAQLFIDTSYTAEEMVMDFFSNSCVTPSNITYTGANSSLAFFDAGNTGLGTQAGIFLSTGDVFTAAGANDSGGTSGNMGSAGDPDLEALVGFQSFDATILEMDITATGDQLDFSYVFASEEYPEFVNSGFNDVFAFFISGPGINGLENIAMVPGSSEPVSINSINSMSNAQYYVDNSTGTEIQFDAYTTELIASATVIPNETYHIKIAIADISDSVFDSGIFLGIESLCGSSELIPPANTSAFVDGNTVTFENQSKYATSYFWDFGDSTTSVERYPEPHIYAEDGFYTVTLITYNFCCSDTLTTNLTIGNPTSVQDLELNTFDIFPNPVNDYLKIQTEGEVLYSLELFDTKGTLIQQIHATRNLEINTRALETGMYFLKITYLDKVFTEKIIKQ